MTRRGRIVPRLPRTVLAALAVGLLGLCALAGAVGLASQPAGAAPTVTASPGTTPSGAPGSGTPVPAVTPSAQDLTFLRTAHLDNLAEIQAGTAAEHRATSGAARNLGGRLVRDHTSLDADLQRIATRFGIALPTAATQERRNDLSHIGSLSGHEFDHAWVGTVTLWNTQALSDEQEELRSGTLIDVQDLARDAITVVRSHLARLDKVPTAGPERPTPTRTNTDDYAASQSPVVVGVAAVMVLLGMVLVGATGVAFTRRPARLARRLLGDDRPAGGGATT